MDKKIIQEIKKALEARQEKIEAELAKFAQKDTHNKDDYRAQFPDFGDKDDENIAEVAAFSDRLSLEQNLEKALRDIKSTLKRIEDGKYGVCKYCGNEINPKRLQARPTSSACIDCKKKLTMEV